MKKIEIHTDGACHGNPGAGGWAALLSHAGRKRELSGGEPATTNNRMELQAAIAGFQALKEPCEVDVFTDSKYLQNGVTKWMAGWKRNGWRTKSKRPVKNADLWKSLDAAISQHKVRWLWLKGHAGHLGNELCDLLANEAIKKVKEEFGSQGLKKALEEFEANNQQESPQEDFFNTLGG